MNSLVAVDVGNSSIKLGWFPDGCTSGELRPSQVLTLSEEELASPSWNAFCAMIAANSHWAIASVNQSACDALTNLLKIDCPSAKITHLQNSMLPISTKLDSPELIGTDRLLAVLAVRELFPYARPAIVIDSGTAVTVDVLDAQGEFAGGVIMPGSALIARALNAGTSQLPEVNPDGQHPPSAIGINTSEAISAGIFWGLVGSIKELIYQQRQTLGLDTPVFISGGDRWLARHLNMECKVTAHLCLHGIAIAVQSEWQL